MTRKNKDFVTEKAFEEFVNDFDWSESEIGNISDFDDDSLDDFTVDKHGNADLNVTGELYADEIDNNTNQDEPILNETDDNIVCGHISQWHQYATFYKDVHMM